MPSIHVKEPIPPEETEEKIEPDPAVEKTEPETSNETPAVPSTPESIQQQPSSPVAAPKNNKQLIIAGAVILILIIGILVISLINNQRQLKQKDDRLTSQMQKSPEDQTKQEAEDLKKELSQYLELPADEVPTVATVVDASKVKGQSFFANTQNGDKVLLFAKSGKAILYRPSTKKIVEVAPINLNQNQQTVTPPPSPTPTTKTNR